MRVTTVMQVQIPSLNLFDLCLQVVILLCVFGFVQKPGCSSLIEPRGFHVLADKVSINPHVAHFVIKATVLGGGDKSL